MLNGRTRMLLWNGSHHFCSRIALAQGIIVPFLLCARQFASHAVYPRS